MAITLGDLRTYCAEIASPDTAGTTAQREFMVWINSAIQRLYREHSWTWIQKKRKIYLETEDSGTGLAMTAASRSIVLAGGETLLSKYLLSDEAWTLVVPSESLITFKLLSIDNDPTNTQGTLEVGSEWTGDTESGLTYYWVRDTFPLPDDCKQVFRVQCLQSQTFLDGVLPEVFDAERAQAPSQRGGNPRIYTVRAGKIEFYPTPGTDAQTVEISYRRGAPSLHTTAEADSVEIDWPDEWRDLLYKGLQLEASFHQAENAPIPYALAEREYEKAKATYMALDGQADNMAGPMQPNVGGARRGIPGVRRSFSYRGPLNDRG